MQRAPDHIERGSNHFGLVNYWLNPHLLPGLIIDQLSTGVQLP